MHKVAVLVGSLRRDSHNRKLARALEALGSDQFTFVYPDLDLPLYNDDLWSEPPAGVLRMKEEIVSADAVLFVTPEYNRSIPAVIKNAIDWASRPYGKNSWAGKAAAIVGTTPGAIGTAAAQAHLRSIIVTQDVYLMGQPEVYFTYRPGIFADDGSVAEESAGAFLKTFLDRFDKWITAMPRGKV